MKFNSTISLQKLALFTHREEGRLSQREISNGTNVQDAVAHLHHQTSTHDFNITYAAFLQLLLALLHTQLRPMQGSH